MSETGQNSYIVQTVNLTKSYEDNKCVLDGLCVHVKQGSIYGLLGSSGCGKTTLISCLLGLRKWEKGQVYMFGNNVRNTCNGIGKLSSHVGYMPQDLALQEQLTPVELFCMYGSLYEMKKSEIKDKSETLVKLLNLSACKNRQICDLSGGQQRRVSLAVTLLNTPKLLILDEPTVGVDPLLRVSIWDHLQSLCSNYKVTIVISTHYVEELRNADTVGILRNGKLVAEHNPNNLIRLYSTTLLERAVLNITQQDHTGIINPSNFSNTETYNNMLNSQLSRVETKQSKQNCTDLNTVPNPLWKRLLIWWKQVLLFAFYMQLSMVRIPISNLVIASVPIIQLVMTIFVIGTEPKGIKFGVINNEVSNWTHECAQVHLQRCDVSQISCRFIHNLKSLNKLTLVEYNSSTEATPDIKSGNLWGYLEIPSTFTEAMIARVTERQFVDNSTLDDGLMHLQLDMSEYTVTTYIFLTLRNAYSNLISGLNTLCDFDLSLLEYPVSQGNTPVYGEFTGRFEADVVPPVIILIIVELTVSFVPMALLNEYQKGSLQRIQVAGLSTSQAMVSNGISIGVLTLVQSLVCSGIAAFTSSSNIFSSNPAVYISTLVFTTMCGVALGTFMAIIFKDAKVCIVLIALYVPIVSILMGIIRPRSAIPYVYQIVSYFIPLVAVADSLKSIVNRRVGLIHPTVYPGVGITIVWFFILIALCYLGKRRLQT